jgi:hypothetical protein
MYRFPNGSRAQSFEPDFNHMAKIEIYHVSFVNVKLALSEEDDSPFARMVRIDLVKQERLLNRWWLSTEKARNHELYMFLRRHIPWDIVETIWSVFLVIPFTSSYERIK